MQIQRKHVDSQCHFGPLGAHLGTMLYLGHAQTNAKEPCWALEIDLEATWAPCRASSGQLGGHAVFFGADLGAMLDVLGLIWELCWASGDDFGAMLDVLGPTWCHFDFLHTDLDAMLDFPGPTRRPCG